MFKTKIIIVFSLLFFTKNGFTQERPADVIGVVSMGELEFAFIQEDANFVYKTSPFHTGELSLDDVVVVENTGEEGQIEIIAPNLSSNLYAYSIITVQGLIPPPMDNMPYVENGILFFQTQQQASDFFVDLISYMDNTRVLDEAHIDEDKLDNIESYFTGYTSYRTAENIFYDWENQGFTDEEIIDYMSSDFLNDDILKTLVNENRFVGIGDSVYFFLAADFRISTHKNNLIGLMDLSAIKNEQDFFKRRYMAVDDKFSIYSGHSFVSGKAQFVNQADTYRLVTDYVLGGHPCNSLQRNISVDGQQWTKSTIPNEGYLLRDSWFNDPNHANLTAVLTIDWGDGSTIETINNYDGSIVNHTYASEDVYEIQVSIDFPSALTPNSLTIDPPALIDGQGQGEYLSISSINTNSCTQEYQNKSGETNNGTWKLTAKVWSNGWFATRYRGSYTHAWKKIGSHWKRRNAGIRTEIHSTRVTVDCGFMSQKDEFKHNHNDKRVEKSVYYYDWVGAYYGNGDIHSFHELYPPNGGVGSAFSMTLSIWHCN